MASLNLHNSLCNKLIKPFWAYRSNINKLGGVPITFEAFAQTRPDGGTVIVSPRTSRPIEWVDLFNDMGVNPYDLTLSNLASRNDDYRYLFGPIIEDAFTKGFLQERNNRTPLWSLLCSQTGIPTLSEGLTRAWMQFEGTPSRTAEGEQFPVAKLKMSSEHFYWGKYGLTLQMTNEFARATPIPVVEDWLAELGMIYQVKENERAINALINGDLESEGNATPVIGVVDPEVGIQYEDFVNVWIRGAMIGENWFTMVSGEQMGRLVSLLDEFKVKEVGSARVQAVNSPEPQFMNRFVNQAVPENQILFVDESHAMRQRVFFPISLVESDHPENWTRGLTIAYSTVFERIADKATIIVDQSKSFQEHGFPSWYRVGGVRPVTG